MNKMNKTRVLALLPLFVVLARSFSWDIVVGEDKRLKFYENGVITHSERNPSLKYIYAVTYDPVDFRVLFADYRSADLSISSFDLTTRQIQTLVTRKTNAYYKNLAYDPLTQLLFWNENKEIYSISLKPTSSDKLIVGGNHVITADEKCGDIAVDSCGGYIYWATAHHIERAAFDGSKREVLIEGDVLMRRSLEIDQETQSMYWVEETHFNHHCIESADLNGKNRKRFYFIGTEYWASSLAVSKDYIYWRSHDQRAILQLPKHQQNGGVAPIVYSNSTEPLWTSQLIAANYTINEQWLGLKSCEALKSYVRDSSVSNCTDVFLDGSSCHNYCFQGNCTISADEHPKCSCEPGYSGERCEVNACHMYCLHGGVCSLNEEAEPVCQCTADYDGERCEVSAGRDDCVSAEGQPNSRCSAGNSGESNVNACYQYCLNDGVCSLNESSEPVCQCTGEYEGDRCDVPSVLVNFFIYACKNIPPGTLCKGVNSTCAATVV